MVSLVKRTCISYHDLMKLYQWCLTKHRSAIILRTTVEHISLAPFQLRMHLSFLQSNTIKGYSQPLISPMQHIWHALKCVWLYKPISINWQQCHTVLQNWTLEFVDIKGPSVIVEASSSPPRANWLISKLWSCFGAFHYTK